MNKVEAVIRIRPLSADERSRGIPQGWHKIGDRGLIQHLNSSHQEVSAQTLLFDWVFSEDAKNEDLFRRIGGAVEECMGGVNVCIIAYGQTSSGKTHTMKGTFSEYRAGAHAAAGLDDPGIIPRSIERIFSKKILHKMALSYIEVYNENIYDLLGDPGEALQIRESGAGDVYIKDAVEAEIHSKEEAYELFRRGNSVRKVSATRMNRESSRSHAVLQISVRAQGVRSSLVFVDLAGSERVGSARTSGATLKEGAAINKSLLALTGVISKLSKKHPHIPFRDAKLTRILQPALSGPSKTIMICAISPTPSCIEETVSTLALASRARNIEIKPVQKPQIRSTAKAQERKAAEIEQALKAAKKTLSEIKECLLDAQYVLDEICRVSGESSGPSQEAVLAGLLEELRTSKTEHVERVSELAETVQYLVKQEKILSESIQPSPSTKVLLNHLAEGDFIIQQQKQEIANLKENKHINDANISMALEMDRLKRLHQREKRIMQLKIDQLRSQMKSRVPDDPV
ncbi:uncharacterized protein NEMAJ01_0553 [Nematocida major]|uniref:uncharacterized protein n=1 Tax=Nematocida major TaxID=1912982 RepID=UPI0020080DC1|nr:uncharacterized protein NEMAJ01_0553 [Nematocida major]KAH9385657.1 hypothetical protein NEMAJ01_0553 [Nematocida major]